MSPGLIDTNVFIHAHTRDRHSAECRRFLEALENGVAHAWLDPIVLHEMSYALPRYIKGMTRVEIAEYLLVVLQWEGIDGEKDVMVDAVTVWLDSGSISFADAYLAARAKQLACSVYTINRRDFQPFRVETPDPLPA